MVEALPLAIGVAGDNSGTVIVRNVSKSGEIEFFPSEVVKVNVVSPSGVKLPIPSPHAYQQVHSTLVRNVLRWKRIKGEALQYNIFFNPITGNNVLYDLYGRLVGMLAGSVDLPPVGYTGSCRISHLCEPRDLYVQPLPVFVDTVAYLIYLEIYEKRRRNSIQPAQHIAVGKIYIYAEGGRTYRVRLLERNVKTEPTGFQYEMSNRVRREKQTIVSIGCNPVDVATHPSSSNGSREDTSGEKRNVSDEEFPRFKCSDRDHLERIFGEKVKVFRIDYGGPTLTVYQAFLYTLDDVHPELNEIGDLALPVTLETINESIVSTVEYFREEKRILYITRTKDSPATAKISDFGNEKYFSTK